MGGRLESKGPLKVPFVDLRAQHRSLASELQQAIAAVIERADFVLGEEVRLFENEFAAYCEAEYAAGCSQIMDQKRSTNTESWELMLDGMKCRLLLCD